MLAIVGFRHRSRRPNRALSRPPGKARPKPPKATMRLALFQPDIAQNTAAILRLGACLGVGVDLIEPFGFIFGGRRLKRVGMDYLDLADTRRHLSWERYLLDREPGRLVV